MLHRLSARSSTLILLVVIFFISLLLLFYPINYKSFLRGVELSPHPSDKKPNNRKLHLLLPINSDAAKKISFCRSLFSTLVHGYEPTIINWNATGDRFELQRLKVYGVYEYMMNSTDINAENDLVFMMDALDVWLQLSPATLIGRYEEMATSDVVIGADKTCWPNDWGSPICQQMPGSPLPMGVYGPGTEDMGTPKTRPRFACSGTVIGSVTAMRQLYKELVDALPRSKESGDQGLFNEFLFDRRVSADYRSRLFWASSVAGSARNQNHFINSPYLNDPFVPHKLYPPLLYHGPTGETPVAVHFNDPAKEIMDEWWGQFWWNQWQVDKDSRFSHIVAGRMEQAEVKFAGGGKMAWKEICPDFGI